MDIYLTWPSNRSGCTVEVLYIFSSGPAEYCVRKCIQTILLGVSGVLLQLSHQYSNLIWVLLLNTNIFTQHDTTLIINLSRARPSPKQSVLTLYQHISRYHKGYNHLYWSLAHTQ